MQAEEERNEILDEEYLSPMHFFLKKKTSTAYRLLSYMDKRTESISDMRQFELKANSTIDHFL